jgi:very-short-patch-repair endonuclease
VNYAPSLPASQGEVLVMRKPRWRNTPERKKERTEIQSRLSKYAHKMKRAPTRAEAALIEELNRRWIYYKFQKFFMKIGEKTGYIADFYFPKKTHGKLVVEVDGSSHDNKKTYDLKRTEYLTFVRGCKVIRFTNQQVFDDVSAVVDAIQSHSIISLVR